MAIHVPPFDPAVQLNDELTLAQATGQLTRKDGTLASGLPDRAGVDLSEDSIRETLSSDLLTPDLNRMAPHLWLVSTPRSSHILPLHRQKVRGRTIVTCEPPGLHLVWYHDRIFVKPLPAYLLSHDFWSFCIQHGIFAQTDDERSGPLAAALGLLRTYNYLIKFPVDFKLAQQHDLVSAEISYVEFSAFIRAFEHIQDTEVAPRYTFGELRLTRLNFYTPILLCPKLTYHYMTPQWSSFFGNLLAPVLLVFAILSIVLTAMQVELAVQALNGPQDLWNIFSNFSRCFSVLALIFVAIVVVVVAICLVGLFVHENLFALSILRKKRKGKLEKKEASSAVI